MRRFPVRYMDLVSELEDDGMLLDIYALNTTIQDWSRLLALAPSLGEVEYYCGGIEASLPSSANTIFEDRNLFHNLHIDLGGVDIRTFFYTADEIELFFDPVEITSQAKLDLVLNFCAKLGREIKRDIMITAENSPQAVYFHYSVDQNTWRSS